MRHRIAGRKLGRTHSHRKALTRNFICSVIKHERVVTTLEKAKWLRRNVEKMITLAPVRADTLPENTNYRDDGCDISSSCLACPLPVCKFDQPGWMRRDSRHERDEAVVRARRDEELGVVELADRFQLSSRTIHRILQSDRSGALAREQVIPDSPTAGLVERRQFRVPDPFPPIRTSDESRDETEFVPGFSSAVGF